MGAFESQIAPVDFNDDNLLDCADVDALVAAIVDGDNSPILDLTGDELVDQADLDVWLALAGLENLPSHRAYLPGDANLDGRVDANDLNVVALNWRQNVVGWCDGNFIADGVVDARDLNQLGINWLQDVSGDEVAAAGAREPRAPLANRVVAEIAAAPPDSPVFVAASEAKLKFSTGAGNVESETEYVSSSHFANRYVRRELRSYSTRINSRAHDFHQSQRIDQTRLVDLVFGRW